jgi:3-hydroxyisobutyrate dehydrogenase-like beta-hydroxyacid dehydrogenase
MAKVGFIGLGTMGAPMARNVIKAGHETAVFDVSADAMQVFHNSEARLSNSPADAATGAGFVVTVLPNSPHVREAALGTDGIAEGLSPEALMIDMTTGGVADFLALAEEFDRRGLRLIDAAIGRTPMHAEAGTILALTGGSEADVEAARSVLGAMCEEVIHCGPRGAGVTTKVVNNYMAVVGTVAAAEALALGAKAGLDRDLLVRVIQSTVATNGSIQTVFPKKVLAGDPTPLFAARLAYKDMTLALDLGADLGVPLLTGSGARQAYAVQKSAGRMDEDMSMLLDVLDGLTGAK